MPIEIRHLLVWQLVYVVIIRSELSQRRSKVVVISPFATICAQVEPNLMKFEVFAICISGHGCFFKNDDLLSILSNDLGKVK